MKLSDLAERLGCRLEGHGDIEIVRVARIEEAGPGDLAFLANSKYAGHLASTRASAIIVHESVPAAPCAMLRTPHPYLAFAEAVGLLSKVDAPEPGVSPLAFVDATAVLGDRVSIAPFVTIGAGARVGARTRLAPHVVVGSGASIGEDCVVHAHVSIRERVTIGNRVVLQDAAVVGSDGFGFAQRSDGSHQKIPQVGGVVIEDDVEIGAHTAIDRPAVGETRIAAGTKIDNLVQVAHGVRIGRHALLAAQSGIAGSSELDDWVILAGQSGVTGHVHVGRKTKVGAKSVVTKDIGPDQHVTGFPAVSVEQWRESAALLRRLPELRERLLALEARLAAIESEKPKAR